VETIVVVGGGAAGFFAAIAAAEAGPSSHVVIIERGRQALAKVKISGGGRCNVTNAMTDPAALVEYYPRGGAALRGPFTRFGSKEVRAWFEARGVRLKTEQDGRVFPVSDESQTIVDCLMTAARSAGVELLTGVVLETVRRRPGGFELADSAGNAWQADRLLLATGGNAHGHAWARGLGHSLAAPVPSLFTFNIKDPRLAGLAGLSVDPARVSLGPLSQTGPVLITHWGLSGPAVLKLSAWGARRLAEAGYQAELLVNWLPAMEEEALRDCLIAAKADHPRRVAAAQPPLPLPARLWERLALAAGLAPEQRWADLSRRELTALLDQVRRGRYAISGKGAFKEEFVTCGGVTLKEVNFKTMESRVCPGLYLAGEILDIDGLTGGFNFQSAWTTGWLAGRAMAGAQP
jgi:predicted Rossmann fold flavoprotein